MINIVVIIYFLCILLIVFVCEQTLSTINTQSTTIRRHRPITRGQQNRNSKFLQTIVLCKRAIRNKYNIVYCCSDTNRLVEVDELLRDTYIAHKYVNVYHKIFEDSLEFEHRLVRTAAWSARINYIISVTSLDKIHHSCERHRLFFVCFNHV